MARKTFPNDSLLLDGMALAKRCIINFKEHVTDNTSRRGTNTFYTYTNVAITSLNLGLFNSQMDRC